MNYLIILLTLILGVFTGLRILNFGFFKISESSWNNKSLNAENFPIQQVPLILSRIFNFTHLNKLQDQMNQSALSLRTHFINSTFYPLIYFPLFLIIYSYGKFNALSLVPILLALEFAIYAFHQFLKKELQFLRSLSFVLYGFFIILGTLQISFAYAQVLKALFTDYEFSYLLFDSSLSITLIFAGIAFISALLGGLDFMLLFWSILLTQGLVHIHLIWIFAVSGFMSELLLSLIKENSILNRSSSSDLAVKKSIHLYSKIMFLSLMALSFVLTPFLAVLVNNLISSENSDSFQRKDQWVLALMTLQLINLFLRSLVGHFWYEFKIKGKTVD